MSLSHTLDSLHDNSCPHRCCCCCCCSTLITRDNRLLTILGRHELHSGSFALGPLGNLLLRGHPVPSGAAFNDRGELIAADTTTVLYSP
jgi:hypothetical protein